MTVADLRRLYDYGYWANARLLQVIAQLTPEEFTRSAAGTPKSIRDTLVHVMSAEWGWLDRCGGPERGPSLKPAEYPTVTSLVRAWAIVEGYVRMFLSGLTDEDLARGREFENLLGEKRTLPSGQILQHAANHGAHHRGQVALLLRLLGRTPGNIDMLVYDAEKPDVKTW